MREVIQVSMDRSGRILLPKVIRTRLGLKPGAKLEVDIHPIDEAQLHLVTRTPVVANKNGVLVVKSETIGNLQDAVEQVREDRLAELSFWAKP
jgi:AbrB family looped-hinge helix DNA binding protein